MISSLRRVGIMLFLLAIAGLLLYRQFGITEPAQDIPDSNVTVVEARQQTEAEENSAFLKEEYQTKLPEGENVALGRKIKASSYNQVYNAQKAVDGDTAGASYWEGKPDYPNLLTVDLEQATKIHAIRLALNPDAIWGKRTQTVSVSISLDGTNYTELSAAEQYSFDPDYGNEAQIIFDETQARYVRLAINDNSGAEGGQVAEFEVYSTK